MDGQVSNICSQLHDATNERFHTACPGPFVVHSSSFCASNERHNQMRKPSSNHGNAVSISPTLRPSRWRPRFYKGGILTRHDSWPPLALSPSNLRINPCTRPLAPAKIEPCISHAHLQDAATRALHWGRREGRNRDGSGLLQGANWRLARNIESIQQITDGFLDFKLHFRD